MDQTTPNKPLVLVVDDDESMRALLQKQMDLDGYRVVAAENGLRAVDAVEAEVPAHKVTLDAFYIDKYPVTNSQYKSFIDANPRWRPDE